MKKLKLFAVVLGLMLSVAGVFAKPALFTVQGKKDIPGVCPVVDVNDDCLSSHGGAICQVDFTNVLDMSCNDPLRRTN
ncbi:MAG: hypothetical protein HOP08_00755 [Cyclobacteriaceae bacterium]|nr:hypothetical protein [Cyclobacteriaceae bacterium]